MIRTIIIFSALWLIFPARSDAAEMWRPVLVQASKTVFSRPHDVVLSPDKRFLVVADNGNDDVKVLDAKSLRVLGVIGRGELSAPHDVAFDRQGRLLVADTGNDRIALYAFKGPSGSKLMTSWGAEMGSPEGVAAAPDGRVFVTNAGLDTVLALDDGRVVHRAGGSGSGPNLYRRPHDIHVATDGRVIVADPGNNRLQILDRNLNFVREISGPPYNFNEPKYLSVDKAGTLFLADEYNDRLIILGPGNHPVGIYGGVRGSAPGQLNHPEGVEVSGPHIWLADTYNDRILLLKRP